MKAKIDPNSVYWATFNRFELRLPGQCVLDCSHSGQCDEDVAYWVPKVKTLAEADRFQNGPTAEKIAIELGEYGAWDDDELADNEANWRRLVWIAASAVAEDEAPDSSEPSK